MNITEKLISALAMMLAVGPAMAFTQKDVADCQQTADPDRTVAGCSRLLDSRQLPGKQRSVAFTNRGNALCTKGRFDLAIEDANEAIRLDPKNDVAYSNRSSAWVNKNEIEHSIADASAAIKLNPNSIMGYFIRANDFRIRGEYDRALADASQVVRLDAKGSGYLIRASIWQAKGDLDQALADETLAIERGAKESVDKPVLYVERGTTLRYKGEFERALADYAAALRLMPGFITALVGEGLTYEKMGDLNRARSTFQDALDSHHSLRAGEVDDALKTARARLAAINSGETQPIIPPAPAKASSSGSIPTPVLTVPPSTASPSSHQESRRVALVIGNSAYQNAGQLANPLRDANAVAAKLRAIGFSAVTLVGDATRAQLSEAFRTFALEAQGADWATVYYAGHGMEVNGTNYLIPVDAKLISDGDIQREAVPLDEVMASAKGAKKISVVLLDACRENPFVARMQRTMAPVSTLQRSTAGGRISTRGLDRVAPEAAKASGATLVVFAARDGQVALDGEGGDSPFAIAVVQRIATPGVEVNKLFRLVRDDVMEATAGRQEPYTYGSLPGNAEFFFVER